jgi:hypothetical protein
MFDAHLVRLEFQNLLAEALSQVTITTDLIREVARPSLESASVETPAHSLGGGVVKSPSVIRERGIQT